MTTPIGIEKTIDGAFGDVMEKTVAALKEEGFGILTTIDVKKTLKEKIDADFINYTILGACNPPLAHQALLATYDVGLMMPCNVVVSERTEGKITVAAMNPMLMNDIVKDADLSDMATKATMKIKSALEKL